LLKVWRQPNSCADGAVVRQWYEKPAAAMGRLAGQCRDGKKRHPAQQCAPEFISISSSLGEAPHISIVVLPVLFDGDQGSQSLQLDASEIK
jgi:hypothetical protein